MKKRIAVVLLSLLPMLAQASCESVKADISKKIISNGVAESDFTLEIVPNDQADQAGGEVVGHCENDSQKIVYKKVNRGEESNVPNDAGSSHDTSSQ